MGQAAGVPSPGNEDSVGRILARMRTAKNLTGKQLAVLVGMSQPKISRLERGIGAADPEDVARIARALGADEPEVLRLVEIVERSQAGVSDWLPNPDRLASRQITVARSEAESHTFRVFQPAVIPGPLQTSEYAR